MEAKISYDVISQKMGKMQDAVNSSVRAAEEAAKIIKPIVIVVFYSIVFNQFFITWLHAVCSFYSYAMRITKFPDRKIEYIHCSSCPALKQGAERYQILSTAFLMYNQYRIFSLNVFLLLQKVSRSLPR